jgi:hypothetical protein
MSNDFATTTPTDPAAGSAGMAGTAGSAADIWAAGITPRDRQRAVIVLDDVMARVGVDGLTAALAHPGLLASVDQHATAVREALRAAGRPADAVALASYAISLMAAAARMGYRIPLPGEADLPHLDWSDAPGYLLRLVAVCAMADARGLLAG